MLSVCRLPHHASDKPVPLVKVRTGVVLLEIIRVEHRICTEKSTVRTGGLPVVERLAVCVVEQELDAATHWFTQSKHQSVVPRIDDAGLVEDEARIVVDARGVERHCCR